MIADATPNRWNITEASQKTEKIAKRALNSVFYSDPYMRKTFLYVV